jgi:hypothetical protein
MQPVASKEPKKKQPAVVLQVDPGIGENKFSPSRKLIMQSQST